MYVLMEPIETKSSVVRCDGGGGALGHPTIFLNLGKEEKIICPYCSKFYVKLHGLSTKKKKTKGLCRLS
jgi:uncharacterized Zn-finger protein